MNRIPHFSITRIESIRSGNVSLVTRATSWCEKAQRINSRDASVAYPLP